MIENKKAYVQRIIGDLQTCEHYAALAKMEDDKTFVDYHLKKLESHIDAIKPLIKTALEMVE